MSALRWLAFVSIVITVMFAAAAAVNAFRLTGWTATIVGAAVGAVLGLAFYSLFERFRRP